MLQPPSLKQLPLYPVTAFVAGLAIAVTGLWWSGKDIDAIVMNGRVWEHWELWRALTCILPHVGFFHLAFNLYWFWVFGTLMERVYGHVKFAGIVLLLALGSMLAEFAVFSGGVGLSGVGYGLWGMLWVLDRRDARFAGAVDRRTSETFVAWFFLCIVLTVTNLMPIANVAHGVGAGLGALLGLAASGEGALKRKSILGLAAAMILFLGAATIFWPWVNLSGYSQLEIERAGLAALDLNENARAIKLLEISAHKRGAPARTWYNLGVAYNHAKEYEKSLAAHEHAAGMPDATPDIQRAAERLRNYFARHELPKADVETNNPGESKPPE